MKYTLKDYQKSAEYIKQWIKETPKTLAVLGSGLGFIADLVSDPVVISYKDIPNFQSTTVGSHEGKLIFGYIGGNYTAIMKGRFHYYEGYSYADTAYPVRVLKLLGIQNLLVTNAAGGINKKFHVGDLMLITDHIKFFDESPLRGENLLQFGQRFNDMTYAYTPALQKMAKDIAKTLSIDLKEGVYAYMPGPQFETPAEVRALSILGADAVGMSTVPEVITGAHCGLNIIGISCICNAASGILDTPLSDDEVVEVANREKERFSSLALEILKSL